MRNTIVLALLAAAGCAGSAKPQPHPPVAVDFQVGEVSPEVKNQSPETKLKLGHYANPRYNIGLVIDRTGDKAKVRFDGSEQTLTLVTQYFWHRTEYHKTLNDKLLEVTNATGHVTLHVEGAGDDGIWLYRDGDADPL